MDNDTMQTENCTIDLIGVAVHATSIGYMCIVVNIVRPDTSASCALTVYSKMTRNYTRVLYGRQTACVQTGFNTRVEFTPDSTGVWNTMESVVKHTIVVHMYTAALPFSDYLSVPLPTPPTGVVRYMFEYTGVVDFACHTSTLTITQKGKRTLTANELIDTSLNCHHHVSINHRQRSWIVNSGPLTITTPTTCTRVTPRSTRDKIYWQLLAHDADRRPAVYLNMTTKQNTSPSAKLTPLWYIYYFILMGVYKTRTNDTKPFVDIGEFDDTKILSWCLVCLVNSI